MKRHSFFPLTLYCLIVTSVCLLAVMAVRISNAHTVSMSGSPSPPTVVGQNVTYTVTTTGVQESNWKCTFLYLSGSSGDASGPSGGWSLKGTYQVPSPTCNQTVPKTWNVVNQSAGYYWWMGIGDFQNCSDPDDIDTGTESGNFGYYRTL
jgi:hypothetical protein